VIYTLGGLISCLAAAALGLGVAGLL
jgi:hypothetical protein